MPLSRHTKTRRLPVHSQQTWRLPRERGPADRARVSAPQSMDVTSTPGALLSCTDRETVVKMTPAGDESATRWSCLSAIGACVSSARGSLPALSRSSQVEGIRGCAATHRVSPRRNADSHPLTGPRTGIAELDPRTAPRRASSWQLTQSRRRDRIGSAARAIGSAQCPLPQQGGCA